MEDGFGEIEEGLRERGIAGYEQRAGQWVLSRQRGPVWPEAGNSFWVCKLGGDWYVCTWAPYYYRVPREASIIEVAEAFVDVGASAQPRMPEDLVRRFGLVEVGENEFDRLWEEQRGA